MSNIIERSLAGGEISPSLQARTDTTKYSTGLRTCRNTVVRKGGGTQNRAGTELIDDLPGLSRLVNFGDTYLLAFYTNGICVYQNGARVTKNFFVDGITTASPCVVTYDDLGVNPTEGARITMDGISGAMGNHLNDVAFTVYNLDTVAKTFQLKYVFGSPGTVVNSSAFGTYVSGGTIRQRFTITTTFGADFILTFKYAESQGVMTLTHPSYAVYELTSASSTSWTLDSQAGTDWGPRAGVPATVSASGGGGVGQQNYLVSAIVNGEEGFARRGFGPNITGGNNSDVAFSAVTGASTYFIYKAITNGEVYGYIGTTTGSPFRDAGLSPNFSIPGRGNVTVVDPRDPSANSNYPSCVGHYQQRRWFGGSTDNPQTARGSHIGFPKNFEITFPTQDDDAISFTVSSQKPQLIRHFLGLGKLLLFASNGLWSVDGDSSGAILPTAINLKQHGYAGCASNPSPLVAQSTALFVHARASSIFDIAFDFQVDGYRGNDLTVFARHLFDGNTIYDWAFQELPESIIWVRSKQGLLGLTYLREHQIFAWHRHDTLTGTNPYVNDGVSSFGGYAGIVTMPESDIDATYIAVYRGGSWLLERMHTRYVSDIVDAVFMDSSLTYDGRNEGATTMTMSGGTTWAYDELLTLTASASYFASTDIGNAVHITGADGSVIRFTINGYTSATVVTGHAHMTVPAGMRSVAFTDWARAVDEVTGLWHLEGQDVSVFADGYVVASPFNESYETITVASGAITLPRPYAVIHVGLPYISDLETLDIDTDQGESLADKKKMVGKVTLYVEDSRGIWVGGALPDDSTPLEGLTELKIRNDESYDDPVALTTGTVDVLIRPEWNSSGRIGIRQVDPVPLSVLAIVASGLYPFRK